VGVGRGEGLYGTASDDHRVQLVAVCDLDIAAHDRRGLSRRYASRGVPLEKLYTDFDRFLAHDMDAVMIATPPACHASQSIAALNAGLHVLCEIPTVTTVAEGRQLVRAVARSGKLYMAAENCCYWGLTGTWRELVRRGRLGKPLYAEGEYLHDVRDLMRRRWTDAHFPEAPLGGRNPFTWRATLYPLRYCTHELGPLLTILDDRVTRVMATDTGSNIQRKIGTVDMAVALMKTAGGVTLKELAGFCLSQPQGMHYYSLYGTKGMLETRRWGAFDTLAYFDDIPNLQGVMTLPLTPQLKRRYPAWVAASGHSGADGAMVLDFINAVDRGGPSPIPVHRGLDFTLPGILATESAKRGSVWMDVPDPRAW
jgi:predicted dehydrogenase